MQASYNFEVIRDKAIGALRNAFQNSSISVDEGWHGRVHIKIVSPEFDGLTEPQRQDAVWSVLKEGLGEEATGIALVLPFGMDEL